MKLMSYNQEQHADQLANYCVTDDTYSGRPQEVVSEGKKDRERHFFLLLDDGNNLVGFFCLHTGRGPETYGFSGEQYGLIRSFSIDDRYRRKGHGLACFSRIFEHLAEWSLSHISHLVLAVNEKNEPAQKLYQQAGFKVVKSGVPGARGPLLIMEKRR